MPYTQVALCYRECCGPYPVSDRENKLLSRIPQNHQDVPAVSQPHEFHMASIHTSAYHKRNRSAPLARTKLRRICDDPLSPATSPSAKATPRARKDQIPPYELDNSRRARSAAAGSCYIPGPAAVPERPSPPLHTRPSLSSLPARPWRPLVSVRPWSGTVEEIRWVAHTRGVIPGLGVVSLTDGLKYRCVVVDPDWDPPAESSSFFTHLRETSEHSVI